jgi:hypothetical protein
MDMPVMSVRHMAMKVNCAFMTMFVVVFIGSTIAFYMLMIVVPVSVFMEVLVFHHLMGVSMSMRFPE